MTVTLELTELRVQSRQRMDAIVAKADPFQQRKWSWHRPYSTAQADQEIETAFDATFGPAASPAAPVDMSWEGPAGDAWIAAGGTKD